MDHSTPSTHYAGSASSPGSLESNQHVPTVASSPELAASGPSTARGSKRGSAKSASHSRRKGPAHIPRPRNAFILFRCHAVANNLVPEELERDHRNISRIISHMWNSLSLEDRKTWQLAAQKEKEEHQRLYPDYKYQPVYRKPVTKQRNVARPHDVQEKCEQAADLIMKMYGDKGIVKDENGVTMSESARKKQERREAWKLKCSLPRASRATSRKASSSPSKVKKESPSSSTSSLPRLTIDEVVSTSRAGDLATSVLPSFSPGVFLDPGNHVDALQRRSSSVPPLDDASGESMTQAMLQNVSIEPVSLHRYPAHSSFGRQLDSRNSRTTASQSLFGDWEARMHQASSARSEGATSPLNSGDNSLFGSESLPTRNRKGPPPPLLAHPHLRHVPDAFGSAISPLSDVRPHIDLGTARPRTMESATPRTTSFSMASRGLRNRLGHLTDDVMLISPMQFTFEAPRRASAAWQNWTRMSNFGLVVNDAIARRTSIPNPGHSSSQPTMPYGGGPSSILSPTFNVDASRAVGSDVLLEHGNGDPASHLQPLEVGLRNNSDDDVFHFSPDFLETRSELGSLGPSRGRSHTASTGVSSGEASIDPQAPMLLHDSNSNGVSLHTSGVSSSAGSAGVSSPPLAYIRKRSRGLSGSPLVYMPNPGENLVRSPDAISQSDQASVGSFEEPARMPTEQFGSWQESGGMEQGAQAQDGGAQASGLPMYANTPGNHQGLHVNDVVMLDSSLPVSPLHGRSPVALNSRARDIAGPAMRHSPLALNFDTSQFVPGAQHPASLPTHMTWSAYDGTNVGRPARVSSLDAALADVLHPEALSSASQPQYDFGRQSSSLQDPQDAFSQPQFSEQTFHQSHRPSQQHPSMLPFQENTGYSAATPPMHSPPISPSNTTFKSRTAPVTSPQRPLFYHSPGSPLSMNNAHGAADGLEGPRYQGQQQPTRARRAGTSQPLSPPRPSTRGTRFNSSNGEGPIVQRTVLLAAAPGASPPDQRPQHP